VRNVVSNLSRFHILPGLYAIKLDGLTMQMVAIPLNLYNLDGSVTAGIGARFNRLLFISPS